MIPEAKALIRAAGMAGAGIALVLGGIAIGVNLWPRAVTIERHIVERSSNPPAEGAALLRLADVIEGACPGVVAIDPGARDRATPGTGRATSRARRSGSQDAGSPGGPAAVGFVVSSDGDILTSARGLPDGQALSVALNDGRVLPAELVRSDDLTGLALLKVEAANLTALEFARQGFPRVGDLAIAVASPAGSGCSERFGLIGTDFLAEGSRQAAYVRSDPPTERALPGTPLIDADGRVVGIAGLRADDPGAILPAQLAARATALLLRGETPPETRIGLVTDDLSPQLAARLGAERSRGAVVLLARPGGAAAQSGLRAGDVILSAADAPISGASELGRVVDARHGPTPLQVLRKGDTLTIELATGRAASR